MVLDGPRAPHVDLRFPTLIVILQPRAVHDVSPGKNGALDSLDSWLWLLDGLELDVLLDELVLLDSLDSLLALLD